MMMHFKKILFIVLLFSLQDVLAAPPYDSTAVTVYTSNVAHTPYVLNVGTGGGYGACHDDPYKSYIYSTGLCGTGYVPMPVASIRITYPSSQALIYNFESYNDTTYGTAGWHGCQLDPDDNSRYKCRIITYVEYSQACNRAAKFFYTLYCI